MSFYVLKFDFLSFKPRTWIENGRLISRTSILGQVVAIIRICEMGNCRSTARNRLG